MNLTSLHDDLLLNGCKQDAQVLTLITACIEGGTDTGPEIIAAIASLGINRQYAGLLLAKNTGRFPARHRWFRDESGHYQLHL